MIEGKGMDTRMNRDDLKTDERQKDQNDKAIDQSVDKRFIIEEIQIEELAVDGICGVY